MTETRQDFEIWTGDTIKIKDTVSGGDISGNDIVFKMFDYKGGPEVLEKTDADTGTEIVDADTLTVQINGSDTDGLTFDGKEAYYYRIIVTDSQGNDRTVTTGEILVHE